MNDRQKRFADEYLIDLNAEAAAIRAGYSPRYARGNAHKLVANSGIQAYIQKRMNKRSERTEITQDKEIEELAIIAFSNATDYAHIVEKQAIAEIDGIAVPLQDAEGNPVMYRTVELTLTDELTENQQKAIAVIKKGKDGFEVRPYDKIKALEKLGQHLGMWSSGADHEEQRARIDKLKAETARIKGEDTDTGKDDGFIEALKGEVADTWEDE